MTSIFNSWKELIGKTPLIRLSRLFDPKGPKVYAKLEFMNLSGSIKDRIAYYMIREAEKEGNLKKGMTIIVPSTGNTGIAFSAVGNLMGYKVIVVIPEEMSIERFQLMNIYGAKFITVPGGETNAETALEYAMKVARGRPNEYYVFDQWSEENNPKAHYETTGRELIESLNQIDIFISAIGSGGTLIGVGKRLKETYERVMVIGVEPEECPIIKKWLKGEDKHECQKHGIEGIGDGFIPNLIKENRMIIDDIITVSTEEAIKCARDLILKEGVAGGISSGANLAATAKAIKKYNLNRGDVLVTILPDSATRYFSTELFKKTRPIA